MRAAPRHACHAYPLLKQHARRAAGQYQLRLEGGGEEWRHLTDHVRWISASPLGNSSSSAAGSSSEEATSDDSDEASAACIASEDKCYQ